MEDNKTPRLLISFVMDNGCTIGEERMRELLTAFTVFAGAQREKTDMEWELIAFEGLNPTAVKAFDQKSIGAVTINRFPLLGRAVMAAVDRLTARAEALKQEGVPLHRPWLFILSDGFTVDSMEEAAARLDGMEREGKLMYLPFKLSEKLNTDRLGYLDRNKHMIEIKQSGIEGFFAFVSRMIESRATLGADVGIKVAKSDFEGWAEL